MIILDTRRMKAYEALKELGSYSGKEEDYIESLWMELISDDELMSEFMYYLDKHSIYGEISCEGYTLTDLYFYNLRQYEIHQDIGKNYADCDKEALVLDTFTDMALMKKEPRKYVKKLEFDPGMDMM